MDQLFIGIKEAARLCDAKSRGWIYRKERQDPTFPRLVRLGKRKTVLNLEQLKEWVKSQTER